MTRARVPSQPVSWEDALAEIADRLNRSRRRGRWPGRPECPLHRHLRDDRVSLPVAFLQPARCDRGRPGHGLQQGGTCRSRLRLWDLARGIRPPYRDRRLLDPRLGSQPVRLRAAPARALAARGPRSSHRRRPARDGNRQAGGSAPSPVSRKRRRARLFHDARALARRAPGPGLHRGEHARLRGGGGRDRAVHAGWGEQTPPASPRRSSRRRPTSTGAVRRCSGSARDSSASRPAATSSGRWRSFRR